MCVQAVSERSVFRSIRLMNAGELSKNEEQALIQAAHHVAGALVSMGYFGPLGIDGFRYMLNGESAFCALSETNARYSMGFVTGFHRHPSELTLE